MELRELRDFAKRMGGDVPMVVTDGYRRYEINGIMAERTASGETLVLAVDIDSKETSNA
jgi:hypothetical protein